MNPGLHHSSHRSRNLCSLLRHYCDVIMGAIASQITGVSIVFSTVCSGADQRKHQSSASLVFVRGIHRGPVNSPHKGPVTRKMFPFDDVIMVQCITIPSLTYHVYLTACVALKWGSGYCCPDHVWVRSKHMIDVKINPRSINQGSFWVWALPMREGVT